MKSHANTTQSRLGALISTASLTLPLASQAARNAVLPSLDQTLVTITAQATNCVLPESPASPFRGAFEVTFQSTYGLADLAALKNQLTDPGVGLYFDSPRGGGRHDPLRGQLHFAEWDEFRLLRHEDEQHPHPARGNPNGVHGQRSVLLYVGSAGLGAIRDSQRRFGVHRPLPERGWFRGSARPTSFGCGRIPPPRRTWAP